MPVVEPSRMTLVPTVGLAARTMSVLPAVPDLVIEVLV